MTVFKCSAAKRRARKTAWCSKASRYSGNDDHDVRRNDVPVAELSSETECGDQKREPRMAEKKETDGSGFARYLGKSRIGWRDFWLFQEKDCLSLQSVDFWQMEDELPSALVVRFVSVFPSASRLGSCVCSRCHSAMSQNRVEWTISEASWSSRALHLLLEDVASLF